MEPKQLLIRSRSFSIFVSLIASALLLASCGGIQLPGVGAAATSVPPSPTPLVGFLDTPTAVPPSPTPLVVQETPTVLLPSSTPLMPLVDTETPTSIPLAPLAATVVPAPSGDFTLSPGTTAGLIEGTIDAGQVLTYTVGAAASQPMTVILGSTNKDVTFGVYQPDGSILLDPALKRLAWQMVLPTTGIYKIQLTGGTTTEYFSLTIKLPQAVSFASGATSATLNGSTVNGYLFSYSLYCSGGQTMNASLNVPASTAYLDIYGISTGTLLNAVNKLNAWSGTLPITQDYVVEVVPANGQQTDYTLTVACTGVASSGPYSAGSINFAPNTTAAVLTGTVEPGQVVSYTMQIGRGQPLILLVASPYADVTLGVLYPNGDMLLSPAKKWAYYQIMIPQTGLYTIQVIGGKVQEKFTLTTKVGEIVYFPPGKDTVSLPGNTWMGYVHTYAFFCSGGQEMTVSLNVPASKAYLDVFGIQTGELLSYKDHATSWTGTIPTSLANQEIVVEVIPNGGFLTGYTLTVTVP